MDCGLPGSSVHVNYVSVKARVFPGDSDGEESAAMQETHVHSPGEGNGNPLQYFCLENPMDRGGWWAAAHVDTPAHARTHEAGEPLTREGA